MSPMKGDVYKRQLVGGVLPHFAQQIFFAAVTLDGAADLLNKIIGQLVGHIQANAGSPQAEPIVCLLYTSRWE